ncbi:hypothetical protein KFU94_67955 [Chloroflexi bacterium TSY]|nr:hypothetical protein [Chloroflexi bacterium TSY]
MLSQEEIKQALTHVLWIGGGPDAGKTSVTTVLAEKYGWYFYSKDEHLEDFWENYISQDPNSYGNQVMKLSLDERWLQPIEEQLQRLDRIGAEIEPLILNGLMSIGNETPIIFEGNSSPKFIVPYLSSMHQAIWMVPTESFRNDSFYRREKHLAHEKRSDPQQTLANHIARDRAIIKQVADAVRGQGFKLLETDGSHSIEEAAEIVKAHFEPHLAQFSFMGIQD